MGADWEFNNGDGSGTVDASRENGLVVGMTWMGLISDSKLLLKEVVSHYGYPEYVKPVDCREGMCTPLLLYPDLGMFFMVFIENGGTVERPQVTISADIAVDRVYFIQRGMDSFQRE